jgi:SAM-dependent methyltransferase
MPPHIMSLHTMSAQSVARHFHCPDLQALYSEKYDERMIEWREICADEKSSNIEFLVGKLRSEIQHVLDVGCGTGAVLERLAEKKIGRTFTGIEIGCERSQSNGRHGVRIHGYNGNEIPYDDRVFDFVYAAHVLEYVAEERAFLAELRRVSRKFVYVEVPCELHFRTSRRTLQRSLDIGHINAYTPESFALQLETSGLRVRTLKVFEHKYAVHRFEVPTWLAILKSTVRRTLLRLNESLASRIFTYHCGALCEPAPLLKF